MELTRFLGSKGITGVSFNCRIGTAQYYLGYDQAGNDASIVWDLSNDDIHINEKFRGNLKDEWKHIVKPMPGNMWSIWKVSGLKQTWVGSLYWTKVEAETKAKELDEELVQ